MGVRADPLRVLAKGSERSSRDETRDTRVDVPESPKSKVEGSASGVHRPVPTSAAAALATHDFQQTDRRWPVIRTHPKVLSHPLLSTPASRRPEPRPGRVGPSMLRALHSGAKYVCEMFRPSRGCPVLVSAHRMHTPVREAYFVDRDAVHPTACAAEAFA